MDAAQDEILLIGPDTRALVDISEYLDEHLHTVALAQARHPIDYILAHRQWHPAGAIVRLAGDETTEDFVPLFQSYPDTSFSSLSAPAICRPRRKLKRWLPGTAASSSTRPRSRLSVWWKTWRPSCSTTSFDEGRRHTRTVTTTHVILVGRIIAPLVEISAKLDPREYGHVIAQSHSPLEYLMSSFRTRPDLAFVHLTGTETVVEYHEVLEQNPATCFVFLVEAMPPPAAVAKVTSRQGIFLDRHEPALSISATGLSLLLQRRGNNER